MTETENSLRVFQTGLAVQVRVIRALLMREILTRYGRHNIGFLWLFIEPMLFTVGVMILWSMLKGGAHAGPVPVATFAMTGYSSVLLWRNMVSRCVKAIEPNLSLLYHRNVKVLDVILSRCILEFVGATGSFIALAVSLKFLGVVELPVDITKVLISWFLLTIFAIGISLIAGALSERSDLFDRIWHIFTYILFPFSGAVFMVDWLPETMQKIVLYIPMVHATEMLRHGYFGDGVPTYENEAYLLGCGIILVLIGLAMVKAMGEKVAPE